ncbi:MAG: glycosyltransferase family 39 protein [Acidobacteriaceae bacterium]
MISNQQQRPSPPLIVRARLSAARRLDSIANALEGRTPLFIAVLFVLYVWVLKSERLKPLWHDELYTFYIAQAPTFGTMMAWIRTIDLNPPLYYIAARLTFHLLHPSPFSVRLPSMVAYFVAVLCLYLFVRRRLTPLYGLLGALVLLSSSFNGYSYEARPYAMVLGFLGILAVGWQRSIEEESPRSWLALALVLLGGFGMLLSHVLASVAYAALLLTEAIRFFLRRKPDWILWICLALPLTACITYLAPVEHHSSGAFPDTFQASIVQLLGAYSEIWIPLASLLAAAVIVVVLLSEASQRFSAKNRQDGFSLPEKIFALGFCCVPLVIVLVFMRSHSAYFPRYGMPAIFGVGILVPWLVARWTGTSSRAALVFSIAFVFGIVTPSSIARHLQQVVQPEKPENSNLSGISPVPFNGIFPNLPFVDASGLTFLEMNRRENSTFLSRVYYLTDEQAAIQYANATIFEGFPNLKGKFPIQANIMPYPQFIQQHSAFLVLGTYDYPEDWLLRKLLADHATLRFLGDFSTGYKDEQLYEVTLTHP